jgi:hypothetical protein
MHRALLVCPALTVTVLAVFWQVCGREFLNVDDPVYVLDNPLPEPV